MLPFLVAEAFPFFEILHGPGVSIHDFEYNTLPWISKVGLGNNKDLRRLYLSTKIKFCSIREFKFWWLLKAQFFCFQLP